MNHAMRTPDWLICALLCLVLVCELDGIAAGAAGCGAAFCLWGWARAK